MLTLLQEIAALKREIAYAKRIHKAAQAAQLEQQVHNLYARIMHKPCAMQCRQYNDMIFVLKFLEKALKEVTV